MGNHYCGGHSFTCYTRGIEVGTPGKAEQVQEERTARLFLGSQLFEYEQLCQPFGLGFMGGI